MNLRDQLRDLLPEILPESPSESIKGTELIRLVKFRLNQEYSDATLRYHFSIMCCDPSSPIAKVEQGQGYYLRAHALNSFGAPRSFVSPSQPSLGQDLFSQSPEAVDLAIQRAQKFRAIIERSVSSAARFPFSFERSFSDGAPYHNVWKFPDLAVLDWHVADEADDGSIRVDDRQLEVRRAMALPAYSITTIKIKMDVEYRNYREDFFQCLSHSSWANAGELVIACAINDENLADDLRRLGSEFGVGITTYGLDPDTIDSFPDAGQIRKMSAREFDALQSRFHIQKLNLARPKPAGDWKAFEQAAEENPDAQNLAAWISDCLRGGVIKEA